MSPLKVAADFGRKFALAQQGAYLLTAGLYVTIAASALRPTQADTFMGLYLAYSGSVTFMVTGHAAANVVAKKRATPARKQAAS